MKMLTLLQRNLLIGTCLVDGSMERNGKNWHLRTQHSLAQKPFVCWEHRILKPYVLSLKEFSRYDKRTKKTYEKIKFDTKTLACFNEFYNQFYFDKKKRVPVKIRNLLCDPLALAGWRGIKGRQQGFSLAH